MPLLKLLEDVSINTFDIMYLLFNAISFGQNRSSNNVTGKEIRNAKLSLFSLYFSLHKVMQLKKEPHIKLWLNCEYASLYAGAICIPKLRYVNTYNNLMSPCPNMHWIANNCTQLEMKNQFDNSFPSYPGQGLDNFFSRFLSGAMVRQH